LEIFDPQNHSLQDSYASLADSIHECKLITRQMSNIRDTQAIVLAFSDSVTLALHKMAGNLTPVGSFGEELPPGSIESLFWKYWILDIESCLGQVYLIQGFLQLLSGRDLKGSV
jgi:hypothetical protein